MRFSEAVGRKIVSLATAETIGTIGEFVVDPAAHRVVGLTLNKSKDGDTLLWDSIEFFGPDAVTVSDASRIGHADPETQALAGKDHSFLGKRVLATIGDEIGAVDDIEFEPETGELISIVLPGREIEAKNLVGVGSYAVVVHDA